MVRQDSAINPGYGEAYARVAHQLELHYRYEDAVTYYRKAIEADPHLWSAHSALGIELMRLGKEDEPYKELELAYNNGYRTPPRSTACGCSTATRTSIRSATTQRSSSSTSRSRRCSFRTFKRSCTPFLRPTRRSTA